MASHSDTDSSSINMALENRSTAKIEGEPSKLKLKKILLVIAAILIAGPLELLIILYFD